MRGKKEEVRGKGEEVRTGIETLVMFKLLNLTTVHIRLAICLII